MRERLLLGALIGVVAWAMPAAGADLALGMRVYRQKCASCHGADGKGNAKVAQALKMTIPDLVVGAMSEADTVRIIAEGKGRMPGYVKSLSKGELQAVVDYTRSLAAGAR